MAFQVELFFNTPAVDESWKKLLNENEKFYGNYN